MREKVTLGSLCNPPKKQVSLEGDTMIDYFDISSVDNACKEIISYETYEFSEAPSRARKVVDEGNIIISTVRPNLNAVAMFGVKTANIPIVSTGFCVLDCKENVDPGFVFNFCKSKTFIEDMVSKSTGASYPAVSDKIIREATIPLYSYAEQKTIASKLEKVTTIITLKKQELNELDNLIKSRFVEMFGTIYNNKFNFNIGTLQEVCEPIKDGTHQTPTYTDDTVNGYKFLSSKDVTTGKIDWNHLKYIPENLHKELYARIAPKKGDILLAKNGTTGIAAIVDRDEIFDIYVSLALLRPIEMNSVYLWGAINSVETKDQFDASLKGIGVPNLHLGEIKKTRILVPHMELQKEFAEFVNQVDKLKFCYM